MQEKLGLILEKEDEMECLVGGCNFLLKAIRHEAFTYENGALNFVTNTGKCLFHDRSVLRTSPQCGNAFLLSRDVSLFRFPV